MQNSRSILQRIKTTGNISKITKAMEMVSASKMQRAQRQAISARPYSQVLYDSLSKLASVVDLSLHPFLQPHDEGSAAAILISTDRGLCGSLNQSLFKSTMDWSHNHLNPNVIAVGKKSVYFIRKTELELYAQFTDLPDKITMKDILPISHIVTEEFLAKRFQSVHLIYMDFINTLVQKPKVVQILPLPQIEKKKSETFVEDLRKEYLFEPSAKAILDELLPYYLENSIYHAFLEAKASEHSARMVTMKNASENAKELMAELRLEFNRSRQASVTNELLDITTAVLAQSN